MLGIEEKVEKAARKAAAFSVGGVLAVVGVGFLTVAAWLTLTELRSAVFAAVVIAVAYLGAAAIAFAMGMSPQRPAVSPKAQFAEQSGGLSPMQTVVLSFMQGLEQGRKTRR